MNNNKLISAASSYNIERSLNTPLVGKVALFHATQALLAQARAPQGGDQGFRSGDTRKMAETSRGATVRNVPGTRSEARRSERSVTFVTLGDGDMLQAVFTCIIRVFEPWLHTRLNTVYS